ncbi:hypothetical protein RIF29_29759 [Crotalaria pallida]|uniref:Uncharacterized protein n=1 Tax=Crotalaria pallida TaxID=3830 RepID=A0AAN9EFC8_CROPI
MISLKEKHEVGKSLVAVGFGEVIRAWKSPTRHIIIGSVLDTRVGKLTLRDSAAGGPAEYHEIHPEPMQHNAEEEAREAKEEDPEGESKEGSDPEVESSALESFALEDS